jgi:hypothetical protein
MEHFRYLPEYQVLICKPCDHAVPSAHLHTYLKGHGKEWLGLDSAKAVSLLKSRYTTHTSARTL